MLKSRNVNASWGNNIKTYPIVYKPKSYSDIIKFITTKKNFIVQGNQKSYGDVCLNYKQVVSMGELKNIISFDKKNGIIEVESGLLLKDLLRIIIPNGWFVPTTPGTKYVSLGGMVANNIHGKNVKKNHIKHYIKKIKLMQLNKKIITCSKKKQKKIFDLTTGGFGLTGIILTITIKLKKISSHFIDQKIVEFTNYNEFYKTYEKNTKYEYAVSWIDKFNKDYIKGLHYFGNHSNKNDKKTFFFKEQKIGFLKLHILKMFFNNHSLFRLMNFFFRYYKKFFYKKNCTIDDFFYPQDYMLDWNKIYGRRGFFQMQFIVSKKNFQKLLGEISYFLKKNSFFSCFVVIKKYNEKGKFLNFSGKGYSISFDFAIRDNFKILKYFLNKMIKKYNLAVNLSKDLVTDKSNISFLKNYKLFKKNISLINKNNKINSIFSKRLGI